MASLVAPDGSVIDLTEDVLLGRGPAPDVLRKIDVGMYEGGLTVSRKHARILRDAEEWVLHVEADASNQTRVDDELVPGGSAVRLTDQAFIRLGNVVLLFRDVPTSARESPLAAAAVPLPAPPSASGGEWAARLRSGVLTAAAREVGPLKRVNPFRGLMVDEGTWHDAHTYHAQLARLDRLIGHGSGIVDGLEVVAGADGSSLQVRPGVAVDSQGRLMIVADARSLALPVEPAGTLYVRLRFQEAFAEPQRAWSDIDEYTRVIDGCAVDVDPSPPAGEALELARLAPTTGVRNAVNPAAPEPGEIDLRFRRRPSIRPRAGLAVAQLLVDGSLGPGDSAPHQLGLSFLLREIAYSTPFVGEWAGTFSAGDALPPAALLYVSGWGRFEPEARLVIALQAYLQAGGTVLLDGCRNSAGDAFAEAAARLARALHRNPRPVERGHALLSVRHVFGRVPDLGTGSAELVEDDGLVLCGLDAGCLWAGGPEHAGADRAAVRAALELGVNCALFARQRQHPLDFLDGPR